MPLPLTVSCFSKIQIGFTFLVPAHPGSPGQRAVKRICVCACVCVCVCVCVNKRCPIHRTGFACDSLDGSVRQEVQVLRWTQENQLTDQLTIINRQLGEYPDGLSLCLAFGFTLF